MNRYDESQQKQKFLLCSKIQSIFSWIVIDNDQSIIQLFTSNVFLKNPDVTLFHDHRYDRIGVTLEGSLLAAANVNTNGSQRLLNHYMAVWIESSYLDDSISDILSNKTQVKILEWTMY